MNLNHLKTTTRLKIKSAFNHFPSLLFLTAAQITNWNFLWPRKTRALQRHRLSVLTGNVCEEFQIKTVTVSTLSLQLHDMKPSAHSKPSMPKLTLTDLISTLKRLYGSTP